MKNVNDNRSTEQLAAAFLAHGEHTMTARHGIIVSFYINRCKHFIY